MAFLLRFLEGSVEQCGGDLPWRDVAREARRRNAVAQSQGRPERYLVDSESLVACVIARDRPVWSNRLLLDTLGPAPASILDVVHPSCRELASKCVAGMGVATVPRRPIRLLYGSVGDPVAIVWSVVDQWVAGGEVYQASVGSVCSRRAAVIDVFGCVVLVASIREAKAYAYRWNGLAIRAGTPLVTVARA